MTKIIKYALLVVILYFVVANVVIYTYAQKKPLPAADTMIILGAKVMGNPAIPNPTLQDRLDSAVDYLQQNPTTKVIVCGGQGKDESASEASVMKHYLIKKGINEQRIYLEDKSTRTAQQFIYPQQMMSLGSVVVVTNDFHMLRSIMLAKRSGIEKLSGLSAPVGFKNPDKIRALWREPLALLNSFIFDHPNNG